MNPRLLPVLTGLLLFPALGAAAEPDPAVLATMERAADWQLANPSKQPSTGWVQGAFDTGLGALARVSAKPQYAAALRQVGAANGWKLGPRVYHADDLCIGQTYLELYRTARAPWMIAAVQQRCDQLLAHPPDDNLDFSSPGHTDRWSWCDSLYMAPPAWLGLAAATGKRAYRDYAVAHWWQTSAYLFDAQENLFFRDSTYFGKREPNGRKVFWARGNGWVLGALAHMLELLPAEDPARPRFEAQFREMAARVAGLQQADGTWAASLLDPESCSPRKEMSGTGFFCYGLAWGVNHHLLDGSEYRPAAQKAWQALVEAVSPEGRLSCVQPIGAAPKAFPPESTEAYGPGALLLAGSEVCRLAVP
jgi:rhamnogalacturonyl hydrolase YesR